MPRERSRRPSRRLSRRQRRRLVRTAAALAGAAVAAAGSWWLAAARPATVGSPSAAVAASDPAPRAPLLPELRLGPGDLADPQVSGGRLEVPVVDFAELLPSCHN